MQAALPPVTLPIEEGASPAGQGGRTISGDFSHQPRIAVLLDGGFVTKRQAAVLGRFPAPADIVAIPARQLRLLGAAPAALFRVYYYDAPPPGGSKRNPLSGALADLASHPSHARNLRLQESLAVTAGFALRRGEAVFHGWKIRAAVQNELLRGPRALEPADLVPDISQKGVDLRIGLDVATLAVKRIVETIVLTSGDSDLVPAMKFARREGLRVVLDTLGHGVRVPMREHADLVFDSLAAQP